MSTKFNQQAQIFTVHDARSMVVHDKLPPGLYTVRVSPQLGFYLEQAENFELPAKMYGSVEKDSKRILHTFADRDVSTGVLLVGERGSGKTMLAKKIALDAQQVGIPTLLVSSAFTGDAFNSFIQSIEQDCIVLFDEFEKVYSDEDQQLILTLLDGTIRTKKMFIFTSNEKYAVNQHMQNRPGRVFYLKEYDGISMAFIEEYCKDVLKPALHKHIEIICQFSSMFFAFNFDMLKAICEEMNRFDESPQEAVELLNAKPGFSRNSIDYSVNLVAPNGDEVFSAHSWAGAPLADPDVDWNWRAYTNGDKSKYTDSVTALLPAGAKATTEVIQKLGIDNVYINFDVDDIERVARDGTIFVKNDEGFTMTLTKLPPKKWESSRMMAYEGEEI